MNDHPPCPACASEYTYASGPLLACPDCGHEWNPNESPSENDSTTHVIKDAHGHVLQSGDSIKLIKDLKVKGAGMTLKIGTKIKNIRLVDSHDGHNIDCRVDGMGQIKLKPEFVKKD